MIHSMYVFHWLKRYHKPDSWFFYVLKQNVTGKPWEYDFKQSVFQMQLAPKYQIACENIFFNT